MRKLFELLQKSDSMRALLPEGYETLKFPGGGNSTVHLQRIIQLVDASKSTIDVEMYVFTLREIACALIKAFKRGVLVRVFADY